MKYSVLIFADDLPLPLPLKVKEKVAACLENKDYIEVFKATNTCMFQENMRPLLEELIPYLDYREELDYYKGKVLPEMFVDWREKKNER